MERSRKNRALAALTATLIAGTLAFGACAHKNEKAEGEKAAAVADASTPAPNAAEAPWSSKMQSLSTALSDLLPMVASPTKFAAEANQAKIEADVKAMRSLAHSLNKDKSPPNADPSMGLVSGLFEDDVERALESLRSGNKEYARAVLKDAANYCVSCHTQTDNGPSFPRLSFNVKVQELPRLERAEFYAATRQFDLAVAEFLAALKDPALSSSDAFAWERSARSALAIVVRVQKNPDKAIEVVQTILRNKRAPKSVREPAAQWLKALKEWKKSPDPKTTTVEAGLAQATDLIGKAQKGQKYPLDHSQDVLWFRAGGALHELLGRPDTATADQARALYLAGLAAEATRDMNFWTMHETYYEICIERAPHSKQAQRCFDRLNDSVTLGYSGSAGVLIPPDVRKRLEALRQQAAVPPAETPAAE